MTHFRSLKTAALAALCVAGVSFGALPAQAQDYHDHGGGYDHGGYGGYDRGGDRHYDRDWQRHGFYDGGHVWHWYAGFGPAYGYYAPPPYYYAPPPPVYYYPPVITFGFRP